MSIRLSLGGSCIKKHNRPSSKFLSSDSKKVPSALVRRENTMEQNMNADPVQNTTDRTTPKPNPQKLGACVCVCVSERVYTDSQIYKYR